MGVSIGPLVCPALSYAQEEYEERASPWRRIGSVPTLAHRFPKRKKIISLYFTLHLTYMEVRGNVHLDSGEPHKMKSDRVKGNAKQSRKRLQYEASLARRYMLRHFPTEMASLQAVARRRYPLTPVNSGGVK